MATQPGDATAAETREATEMGELPVELVEAILARVPDGWVAPCANVCSLWRSILVHTQRRRLQTDLWRLCPEPRPPLLAWLEAAYAHRSSATPRPLVYGTPIRDWAVARGTEAAEWAARCGFPDSPSTIRAASRYGRVAILKRLLGPPQEHDQGPPASAGRFMARVRQRGERWVGPVELQAACRGGHVDCLLLLQPHAVVGLRDESLIDAAAAGGHLEMVKLLRSQGCAWGFTATQEAAAHGELEVLSFLLSARCPVNERACRAAGRFGHLGALKLLRDHGCPWNRFTGYFAAEGGHLHVLEYLEAAQLPFDAFTSVHAAAAGKLAALQWLRERACPWNSTVVETGRMHGHRHIVEWALAHGCPRP